MDSWVEIISDHVLVSISHYKLANPLIQYIIQGWAYSWLVEYFLCALLFFKSYTLTSYFFLPFVTDPITLLETHTISLISASEANSLAVTDSGHIFTWGDNTHGQLGRGYTDDTYTQAPKYVQGL